MLKNEYILLDCELVDYDIHITALNSNKQKISFKVNNFKYTIYAKFKCDNYTEI